MYNTFLSNIIKTIKVFLWEKRRQFVQNNKDDYNAWNFYKMFLLYCILYYIISVWDVVNIGIE